MKESSTAKIRAAMAANGIIFLCTAVCLLNFFTVGGDGNMTTTGSRCFRFYTVDSNCLAALAGLGLILWGFRALKTGTPMPRWLRILRFAGTCTVMITFLVVAVFLGPLMGYGAMLAGDNLFMHLTNPLLALISLLFWENSPEGALSRGDCLLSLLPTAAYGGLYYTRVLLQGPEHGGWPDFYGFNMGGRWYLSILLILALALSLALGLRKLKIRLDSRREKQ